MKRFFVYLVRTLLIFIYLFLFAAVVFFAGFFNAEKSEIVVERAREEFVSSINSSLEQTDLSLIPAQLREDMLLDIFTKNEVVLLIASFRDSFVNEGVIGSPLMVAEQKKDAIARVMAVYFFDTLSPCEDEEEDLSSFGFRCVPEDTSVVDFASIISRDLDAAVFAGSVGDYKLATPTLFWILSGGFFLILISLIAAFHFLLFSLKKRLNAL